MWRGQKFVVPLSWLCAKHRVSVCVCVKQCLSWDKFAQTKTHTQSLGLSMCKLTQRSISICCPNWTRESEMLERKGDLLRGGGGEEICLGYVKLCVCVLSWENFDFSSYGVRCGIIFIQNVQEIFAGHKLNLTKFTSSAKSRAQIEMY